MNCLIVHEMHPKEAKNVTIPNENMRKLKIRINRLLWLVLSGF